MSTFAPLQFLKSAQNPLVWTAIDNGTDTRTSLIIYYGAVNTLPADTELYEVNCIMMHQAEKQLYANTGTATTPSWEAFGPNSALPQPLVPGTFLFTDGATVYWATSLVGQVQYNASNLNQYGILNFNDFLVASNDVPNTRINVDLDVVALGADATFISTLEGNLDLANIGGSLDLATQVTGVLNSTNIDITNLESNLDLANIAGSLDLTTQVTGLLPAANIDIADLESALDLGNIGGAIDLTTQVTGLLPAANIDVADLITQLNDSVTVAVDGVSITGDGTTGNPLVATGSSGSSILKVGVGAITDQTIFNAQLPFDLELWSIGTNNYTNAQFGLSDGAYTIVPVFPGITNSSSAAAFSDARIFILEALTYTNGSAGQVGAFGFNVANDPGGPKTTLNLEGAYFVSNGTDLYAQTATGAARTQVNLGAFAGGVAKFRIEFDRVLGTPEARFYINGTLVATITTNLPNSSEIGVTIFNDTGDTLVRSIGAPSVAMAFATIP